MTSPPMAIGAERLEAEHGRGGGGQEGRAGRQAGDEHCASGVAPGPHKPGGEGAGDLRRLVCTLLVRA